jgi:formylglycine-generating enzyme required for sulfatase activity
MKVTKSRATRTAVLVLLLIVAMIVGAQSSTDSRGRVQQTQVRGYWVDTSGLMWAGRDNGKDVSWHKAMKYCRNLRLAGYSDWRLATIFELQDIYDADLETPGFAGPGNGRTFTWHVRGGLLLSGVEWSSSRNHDERGHPSGSAPRFDFNNGRRFNDDLGYASGKRALCVRRVGESPNL